MNYSRMTIFVLSACLSVLAATLTAPIAGAAERITEEEAYEIGMEAYTYLYPMALMDATRRVMTNVPPGVKPGLGPGNAFHHMRAFPPAEFREVVRPNFDTLYSSAWLDLRKEPMIVSAPDTRGRYYLLPMMDMWTDVFASPGKRTTGTGAGRFAVVMQGWKGKLPAGIERIESPTPYVWIIGRTQTNGPADYEAVHKVQDGYAITPLSQWGNKPVPAKFVGDPTVDMKTPPMTHIDTMAADKYFAYAAEILKLHPPHITDQPIVARMRRIGMVPGKSFDLAKADPTVKRAMERAAPDALKAIRAKIPTLARVVNGWQMNTDSMGVYGTYYLKRACVALAGLGANLPEDAIYPFNLGDAEGKALTGTHRYALHFDRDQLPPVNAFWSVTLYDNDGFPTANDLKRYAIGDRDKLAYGGDGSLEIYIQHESPGKDNESNWLPAPAGDFTLTMRLYAPKGQVLDGRWASPAVTRVR